MLLKPVPFARVLDRQPQKPNLTIGKDELRTTWKKWKLSSSISRFPTTKLITVILL
ncbi:MAG: hypothetical protein IT211_07125 [Armatimonadetes bacterium]|nr:hypothetical protein [Armatimonadota bacterium]